MKQFKILISLAVLISSFVILVLMLFNSSPITITLESGEQILVQTPEFFTLIKVLILILCSFFIGSTATYLYYNADIDSISKIVNKKEKYPFDAIDRMLKTDEKSIVRLLLNNNGEMLQNAIVKKTGYSKVKVARIIFRLEKKGIVKKERFGLTNKIILVNQWNI